MVMGRLSLEELSEVVGGANRPKAEVLWLSEDAQWVLRQCHGTACRDGGWAAVCEAAEEATKYGCWEHEQVLEPEKLKERLRLLTRVDRRTRCRREEFVEMVRCPPSTREESEAIEAVGAESTARAENRKSFEAYTRDLNCVLKTLGETPCRTAVVPLSGDARAARTVAATPTVGPSSPATYGVGATATWETPTPWGGETVTEKGSSYRVSSSRFLPEARGERDWERRRREREEYYEQRLQKVREEVKRRDAEEARRRGFDYAAAANVCHEPLSREDEARVNAAVRAPPNKVLADGFNIQVLGEHARRMGPGKWLVDELINFYFSLLQRRDAALADRLGPDVHRPSHFFSSFFFTALLGETADTYDYPRVRRWTKKFDLFAKRFAFIPVNVGNMHWTLLRIDFVERNIRYFDSMGSNGDAYLRAALRYVQDDHRDKKKQPLPDLDQWTLIPTLPDVPRQKNGYDCGVFATFCAHYHSLAGIQPDFDQSHIPHLRKRMMLSILDQDIPFE